MGDEPGFSTLAHCPGDKLMILLIRRMPSFLLQA